MRSLVLSAGVSAVLSAAVFFLFGPLPAAAVFPVLPVLVFGFGLLSAERKRRFIESVLPDALNIAASNMRSGMTPERALLAAARPEFGELSEYIKTAAKKAMAGKPLEKALGEIPSDSRILKRAMDLISEGARYGGDLASVLDEVASEIRDLQTVRKEVRAVVSMYSAFILMAVAAASPLLFGVTTVLTGIMAGISQTPGVSPETVFTVSLLAVVLNSVFGSFVLGIITKGKEIYGFRYLVFLVPVSCAVFFGVRYALGSAIGVPL